MNDRTVTLCPIHFDKNVCYFICKEVNYINHRGVKKIRYVATHRVTLPRHQWADKIVTTSTMDFEPNEVKEIETYLP